MFCRGIRESPLSTSPRWSTRGSCSPLVRVRTKCSLRADSSTLRRSESPTTAHKFDTSHPQELRVVFMPPITTEPSRWWRSPRVTSKELSLDPSKTLESGGCTLDSWNSTREGFTQEISQFSILSRLLLLSCTTRWFSTNQMGKRPPMDEVEEYKYSSSSPRVGQPLYTENGSTERYLWESGDTVRCEGELSPSLGLGPDAPRRVRC